MRHTSIPMVKKRKLEKTYSYMPPANQPPTMDNPLTLQEAKDQVIDWLEKERNILQNTGSLMWHKPDEQRKAIDVAKSLDIAIQYMKLSDKSKSCPNCLSEDVIMFTADLDICNRCNQTF